ncbi:hypothetical protein C8J56DRAFT_1056847 [Mycena floridula]|nr:hypothetical protein C8J56DRAFT_1056847 [Mycena floridula]
MPDLRGKVAVVTGANSSIRLAFHMAHQFAMKGAKVYVGARNLVRSIKAIEDMRVVR